ncbi:MAG: heme utilization cystosolic carrier protein HutX [Deltaproteobacteria bacterium]|nr:MAG: heme utilization cystosolic carrier protein HutX [Deltaproteobacteria bacterium]
MKNLKEQIVDFIKKDKDFTVAEISKHLGVKESEVLLNLPKETATVADGKEFDKIIQEVENWGEVLVIKVTPSFIFEIRTKIPKGHYDYGFYNFDHHSALSGHLKADDIDKIVFLSAKVVMGMLSHCILFLDKNGDDIFKIYVARDEKNDFLPHQLEAFLKLKQLYE